MAAAMVQAMKQIQQVEHHQHAYSIYFFDLQDSVSLGCRQYICQVRPRSFQAHSATLDKATQQLKKLRQLILYIYRDTRHVYIHAYIPPTDMPGLSTVDRGIACSRQAGWQASRQAQAGNAYDPEGQGYAALYAVRCAIMAMHMIQKDTAVKSCTYCDHFSAAAAHLLRPFFGRPHRVTKHLND